MYLKPKLSYQEQIEHLKKKGVKFELMNTEDALSYLKYNNNFFKLSSYRKNFNKDVSRTRYLSLDFAYLVDLAIIDMYLRFVILKLALNIEHFAKVKLLRRITENPHEDGYCIVQDYLNSLSISGREYVLNELDRNAKSPYCHDVYSKYQKDPPAWVFVELISFGSFLSFYKFCAMRFIQSDNESSLKINRSMLDDFYLMLSVKRIRNASAHSNCIINDLRSGSKSKKKGVNFELTRVLRRDLDFGADAISKKLSNIRIAQILTCLYTHKRLISSQGVQYHLAEELHDFSNRLFSKYTYDDNYLIKSTFNVLVAAIDRWYPLR